MDNTTVVVAETRPTPRLIGYYAALGGVGLSGVLGPTLSYLAAQTGSTLSEISALFVARAAGYVSGSLLAGRAYDRVPGHPVLASAVVTLAAGMALTPLLPWLWLLAALMFMVGAAEGSIDVGANTLIVWTYGDRVGPYMNGLHLAFGVGAFVGPLLVAQAIALSSNVAWAYWALAILILPAAFWLARLPSPTSHAVARAAQAQPVRRSLVALFVACFFFYVGAEVSFGSWVYTYANRLGLADAIAAAYLTSAFWGALTVGRLAAIPIAARFRPRSIMAVNLAGCLLGVGLALLFPASKPAIWMSAIGTGLSMASIFPTFMNLAGRRMPLTAQVSSLFFVGSSLGAMIWPWLIGQLFEPVGPRVAMGTVFVVTLLDAVAFVMLMLYAPRPGGAVTGER
ncbi:MAG TPA: MFS transporter [Anaerolineales bacterium]|nr:MFS transporter [Anaerolineales bacterium]